MAWTLFGLVVATAITLWLVHLPSVQRRLLDRLLPRLETRLGRVVEVESVTLRLIPLTLEVRGLTVAGVRTSDPPVVTAERVYLLCDEASVLERRLELEDVVLEGVDVYVERLAGEDNLPRWRRVGARPTERRFDIQLASLRIERSQLRYSDYDVPLELSARGLAVNLLGAGDRFELRGAVTAEAIDFRLPRAERYSAALAAEVTLDSERLAIRRARVHAPEVSVRVDGELELRQPRRLGLEIRGGASSELFRRLGYLEDQVEGWVDLDADFTWDSGVWGYRGSLEAPRLRAVAWTLDSVRGVVAGDRNGVRVDLEESTYAGGRVRGDFDLTRRGEGYEVAVNLGLQDLDAATLMRDSGLPIGALESRLSGDLTYRFSDGEWRVGAGWGAFQATGRTGPGGSVPVVASLPVTIDGGVVNGRAVRLRAPGQEVLAEVVYDLADQTGSIRFGLESTDLGTLGPLLPIDREPPPLWWPVSGFGRIEGTLHIAPSASWTELQLALQDAVAPGLVADRVRGVLELHSDRIDRLRLEIARDQSAGLLTATLPFSETAPLRVGLDLADWPVADAAPWLPFALPLTGNLTGSVTLNGSVEALAGTLEGRVDGARVESFEVGAVGVSLAWDPEELRVGRVESLSPAGEVWAEGSLRFASGELQGNLGSPGLTLDQPPLAALLGGRLGGQAAFDGHLSGTLERPTIALAMVGRDLAVAGERLEEVGESVLDLRWEEGRVEVAGSVLGLVTLAGEGELEPGRADLELEFEIGELERLARLAGELPVAITGEAAGRVRVRAEGAEGTRADLTLDRLSLQAGSSQLQLLEPATAQLDPEALRIRSFYLGEPARGGELFVNGTVGLADPGRLDLNLQGSLSAEWLEPLLPGVELSGTLDAIGRVRGDLAAPRVRGQAELSQGRAVLPAQAQSLDNLELIALIDPEALVLDSLDARMGGGVVRSTGRIAWPTSDEPLESRFQIAFRNLTLRYPEGWLLRGGGELVWSQRDDQHQIRGLAELDRAYYLRDIEVGLASMVQGLLRRQRQEVDTVDDDLARVSLNVAVKAPGAVRIRNNLADLRGSADLTLRGSLARPVLLGIAEVERGGTLVFNDNEYDVERASLTFANPYRIEPILDLEATTRVAAYDVSLSLSGHPDNLNAGFSSDPPLPDLEVLSLLVAGSADRLGQPLVDSTSELSMGSAAEDLLLGQASSLLSERVGSLFGFDAFRIEPLSTSGKSLSSARVSVGKRLSSRVYATYSYDPSSTANQRLQLEWQATLGLVVRLTQDDDSYTVDLLWERSF